MCDEYNGYTLAVFDNRTEQVDQEAAVKSKTTISSGWLPPAALRLQPCTHCRARLCGRPRDAKLHVPETMPLAEYWFGLNMPIYGGWEKVGGVWARDNTWAINRYIWADNYPTRPHITGAYNNWVTGQPSVNGQDSDWSRAGYVDPSVLRGSPACGGWYNGHGWDGNRAYHVMCKQRREFRRPH